jgi:hypothetical protein
MARKRMIDPAIWEDEDLGAMSHGAFKLFVGLFSRADDYGRLSASPQALKRGVFGFDATTLDEIENFLGEIERACRHVAVYEVDGRRYITLLKWGQYQNLHKPQPSQIPPPPDWVWVTDKSSSQYVSGGYKRSSDVASDNDKPLSDAVEPSLNPGSTQFIEKKRIEKKRREESARAAPAALDWREVYRDVNRLNLPVPVAEEMGEDFAREFARLGADEFRRRLLWWRKVGGSPTNAEKQLEVLRVGVEAMKRNGRGSPPTPADGPRLKSGEVIR